MRKLVPLSVAMSAGLFAAACGSDAATEAPVDIDTSDLAPVTITLVTHDSFAVSEGVLETFTEQTGVNVELIQGGDAGEIVSRAVLTAGQPEGDVMFGIDNTFLQRGLDADLFVPYESPALSDVPDELELDDEHRVTPMDVSDVCINYWTDELDGPAPASLEDLTGYADTFVTMNPESSSPGFAFLLATIAHFGEDGWEDYWQGLVDGGLRVTSGWNDAYYGEFIAGGGDAAIVTSYASSPPADVLFSDPPVEAPRTGVMVDSCFRQIEFAGVLAGTEYPNEAAALIDFMLSPTFQADVPLNMFVYPANETVELPEVFIEFGPLSENPITLTPAEIEAGRLEWTQRWTEIVLG